MLGCDEPSKIWLGVSASTSIIPSLILVEGRLFRMLSTSHNKVVNNSLVMVLSFVIDSSERMINIMSDLSSAVATTKFVLLSNFIILMWPLLEMKQRSNWINESVDKSPVSSKSIALAVKQV